MDTLDRKCNRCGVEGTPRNPLEPNPLRWVMPEGWLLVRGKQGGWGRNCPGCAESTAQRHLAYLRSPARMPLIMGVVSDFWKQYPKRRLGEVLTLAARMRRTTVADLDDLDLASVLAIFTLGDADRAFEQQRALAPIDPWSMFLGAPSSEPAEEAETEITYPRAA